MSQTRKMSLMESLANTAFGFAISLGAAFLVFPLLGITSSPAQNIGAVIAFTGISILRNYLVRRLFVRRS